MRRARREAEFTEFYVARRPALRRTAYLIVRDWHAAEDLTQQSMVKLYAAWPRRPRRAGARRRPSRTRADWSAGKGLQNWAETVQAPDTATARELLVVPPEDLAAIGIDLALVVPTPPPGENG